VSRDTVCGGHRVGAKWHRPACVGVCHLSAQRFGRCLLRTVRHCSQKTRRNNARSHERRTSERRRGRGRGPAELVKNRSPKADSLCQMAPSVSEGAWCHDTCYNGRERLHVDGCGGRRIYFDICGVVLKLWKYRDWICPLPRGPSLRAGELAPTWRRRRNSSQEEFGGFQGLWKNGRIPCVS
jgi:hypothetical protein